MMILKEVLVNDRQHNLVKRASGEKTKGILVTFIFSLTKTKETTNDSSLPELSTPWLSIIIPERRV